MKYFEPMELARLCAEKSPYYKNLYKEIDLNSASFQELPLVDQETFWEANKWNDNQLLTGKAQNGIVFKSGGTTGNPKMSVFSNEEWQEFTRLFGVGMADINLDEGDRVGNLFYSGQLYASFVFIMESLEKSPKGVLHFPLAGSCPLDELVKDIVEYDINVLAGVPTTFMNLAALVLEENIDLPLSKILYGGEALFDDQKAFLQKAFPRAIINSVGYASVDGGHLGYHGKDCVGPEHRVFLNSSLMEILDEDTNEPITELGQTGKLVYTNLARSLMPIIRYPVGDLAQWLIPGEKFLLLGRSEEGARIGPVTINRDDVVHILHQNELGKRVNNFQMILERPKGKDRLRILLAAQDPLKAGELEELQRFFMQERSMYQEAVDMNLIAPLVLQSIDEEQLLRNPRTGKLRILIDQRS